MLTNKAHISASSLPAETVAPYTAMDKISTAWRERILSPLWLCLLITLGLRILLVVHTHGIIDGDEALVGIQAMRILHGDFPIYFYGQAYMGSLEAYFMAALFALFGSSVWMMRAEPILLSLAVVGLTWRLAGVLAEASSLSRNARRIFMTVAALCAAIPPLYDGVIEGRTYGGFIEMLVVILLLFLATMRLTRRWFAGASRKELAWRWAWLGFLVGLGFWIYPLITSAVIAAALWILGACALEMRRRKQGSAEEARLWKRPARELLLALWGVPTGLLGLSPAIGWGATHQWANVTYMFSLGGHETFSQKLSETIRLTGAYAACIAPRVIGGSIPRESLSLIYVHIAFFIIGLVCIAITFLAIGFSYAQSGQRTTTTRQLAGLPALFAVCTITLFCLSSASMSIFIGGCASDFAGRYAAPILLALPFFFATAFTLVWNHFVSKNTAANTQEIQPASKPHQSRLSMAQILLLFLLLSSLGTQAITYGLTSAGETYQSSYCVQAPSDNDPILAYLQEQHIRYFWASNLLAYPLVFKSHLTIIGADPSPLLNPQASINRIPSYTDAVLHADRPSMLVIVRNNETQPAILQMLESLHVTYRMARFPAQLGFSVLVITPLNRSVSPLGPPRLDLFGCPAL